MQKSSERAPGASNKAVQGEGLGVCCLSKVTACLALCWLPVLQFGCQEVIVLLML